MVSSHEKKLFFVRCSDCGMKNSSTNSD
jgi:hypothetical protein